MACGKQTGKLLLVAGGLLLLLSHAAAWHLGRKTRSASADGTSPSSVIESSAAISSLDDLLRRGREREAATHAAAEAERVREETPWDILVAQARAALPVDADFVKLTKDGMAATKGERNGPTPETVAAFGKWLDLDPDAALDFIGLANRDHSMDAFRFELGRWLGQGNEHRFAELMKRFPAAAWPLRQGAQELCRERGANFALEMAADLPKPGDRYWLLMDCLDTEQWQGHLGKLPAIMDDPRVLRELLSSIIRDGDAATLLDEIRAAGFPPEDLAWAEAQVAKREEESRRQQREEEEDRKRREESASALSRRLGLASASVFDRDSPSEEQELKKLAPGFADACADLRDGRTSMADVLALVQRSWPPASDPAVAGDLRTMLFGIAFKADPLGTLQASRASGWALDGEAAYELGNLAPELIVHVATARPEILKGKDTGAWRCSLRLEEWQEIDPEGCRQALLGVPDEVLRTQWLESFDRYAERQKQEEGGDR